MKFMKEFFKIVRTGHHLLTLMNIYSNSIPYTSKEESDLDGKGVYSSCTQSKATLIRKLQLLMKICLVIFLSVFLLACDGDRQVVVSEGSSTENPDAVASFNFRNREMREMMLAESEKKDIEVWINDDRSIGYYLADGEKIDDILTWVYAVYWVNN